MATKRSFLGSRLSLLAGVIVAGLVLGVASPGHAGIDDEHRYTFGTGYSLKEGEILMGLGSIEVGLHDRLQLGTVFLADLFGVYNMSAKIGLAGNDQFRLALELGILYFDTDYSPIGALLPDDLSASMLAVPVGVSLSTKIAPNQHVHFNATYLFAKIEAEDESDEDQGAVIAAQAAGTSVRGMWELDFEGGNALLVGGGIAYISGIYPVAFASYVFGWETFHLELGAGVAPASETKDDVTSTATGFVPRINLWWRF